MGKADSSMGDPSILNALIDMLKNGQGQQITMMVHEAISNVTPSCVNLVGMKDPTVLSNTSTIMPEDVSRITPTNIDVPNVDSVITLPPTSEQVSLRILIDSQSRRLRLLPDTPKNIPIRQEISEQIQLWERALLESAGPTSDEQEHLPQPRGLQQYPQHLRDTTKATQPRVSSIGSHKLGSGGYNNIHGGLVHHFQKESSEEDLKYALLHGSQGLRKHMLDRGEKLVSGHESEEAQQ
ncbi:hypothetical protein SUGI_1181050 [Cryptomeria japonica]|nr:hypothetical protein SUGI_1181050 [Cryptomeria japonica]